MANLILVRHGESRWNAKGIWTGLTDISLSNKGRAESKKVANLLKKYKINIAYTSKLKRSIETLDLIKQVLNLDKLRVVKDEALNERDYGEFTGKNKWEIKKRFGEEKFLAIRRGWNFPIVGGETLKDVYNRVIPYYESEILPRLKDGKNVLIVAHGNSLRALIKNLENISDLEIEHLEIKTGDAYLFKIDSAGNIISKQIFS
jgi:2,3-bisphosphoglycerate-dependent phosphoglycerate mutase